jgi:hypothetical protein
MAVQVNDLVASNDALGDGRELRERIAREGYLFFHGLLDAGQVGTLRKEVLEVCAEGGWLKAGTDPADGIANGERVYLDPEPDYVKVYGEIQTVEGFHRLGHSPAIMQVMGALLGDQVLPHANKIARIMFPKNNEFATPPHQDFVHIQGTTETYSCWVPLGNCPRELGGLAIMPRSHRQGVREYHLALGAGGMGVDSRELGGEWLTTDYQPGDALIFHSLTIHQALPNLTDDRIRFSVDYRYQSPNQPILDFCLKPHNSGGTWDEIYEDWKSRELQYYWKEFDLTIADRDWSYYDNRDAEAMELAKRGDEKARSGLTWIIARHPDPQVRREAEEALRKLDLQ